MADFFTLMGALDAGISLYEKSKDIPSKLNMLKNWLINGRKQIAILGAGGTGKTTLAHYLTDDAQYKSLMYQETPIDEKIKIGQNVIGEYWVAPGQKDRRERYWGEIFREISQGNICGVIHVVSYGYHSIDARLSIEKNRHFREGMTDAEFLSVLTTENRKTEVAILQEMKHRLKDSSNKIWMITLVLKQDLWWNERDNVKDFYMQGAYKAEIEEIQAHKGKERFEHIYISASILSNNFAAGGRILQPTAQGYDENLRLLNVNELLKQLNGFLK
jgi:ABC-type cobalamin/Fe3+-siderophores transport system ATPase subunit